MFLLVQHPMVDLRPILVGDLTGRLGRPNWPGPNPEQDFLRSSGLVRLRRRGGIEDWAGEDTYADASRALRLPDGLRYRSINEGACIQAHAKRVFRRFYSAGVVCRIEVGFHLTLSQSSWLPIQDNTAVRLIAACAELPTKVGSQSQPVALVAAGKLLAAHYLAASTNRKAGAATAPWWTVCGAPAFMIEYSNDEADWLKLPPHARTVSSARVGGEVLHHAWLQISGQRCSTWLLRSDAKQVFGEEMRKLRIHLLRLHAERECLRLLLQAVGDGRIAVDKNVAQADAVQAYLQQAMPAVTRPMRDGIEQAQILQVAQSAINFATPGQTASFDAMRRQVSEKVARYIRRAETAAPVITHVYGDQMNTHIQLGTVTVNGDFNLVTAQNIQNSFNKAAGAQVDDTLKDALKKLTVEIASLAKKLPAEEAEKVSKDLEVLTSEAVSKTPRKAWYELSSQGLLDAAKTVAEMAAPVTTAVKAVLALLV